MTRITRPRATRLALLAGAALLCAAPLAARADTDRTIRVQGHATREVAPDMALLTIGVNTRAPNAAAAMDANSTAARKVIDAAKRSGIAAGDIRTASVGLSEATKSRRDPTGMTTQEPDGYNAFNTVIIRVRDLSRLGQVIRDMVEDGANRMSGLSFDIADRDRIADEVRKEALLDARRIATDLATTAGASLGSVQKIFYPPIQGGRPMRADFAAMAVQKSAVPIEAGAIAIQADVEAVWELR